MQPKVDSPAAGTGIAIMHFRTAALAAAVLVMSTPALAATTFTSKADFLTAVGAVTANDLDSAPDTASYDFGDFTAAAVGDPLDPEVFGFKPSWSGPGKSLHINPPGELATFTFDAPIFAFGIDLLGLEMLEGGDLIFTINEVDYTLAWMDESATPSLLFMGLADSAGFSKVTISSTGMGKIELDNVLYARGVPEPATWAMLLMGFGGLGAALRRRRPQVA